MKLGELITKAKVERCGNRNFPVYSMTMHDGIVEQAGRFKKAIASKDTSSYKVVTKNQLVVGFPIDEGVIYVQNHDEPGIMSPAYNVWDFDQSRLDPAYLELALHSPQSMAYYADKMRGTTARRRSLTTDGLRALTIPLPSMDKQLEIVAVLRGIKAQISYAQDQMSKLDQLVKSRFVEMFGDIDDNLFEVKTIQDCSEKIKDGTHQTPTYVDEGSGGVLFLSSKNVVGGTIDWDAVKYIPQGLHEKLHKRVAPHMGDILLAKNGTTGVCAVVDRDCVFDIYVSLAHIRPLEWMNSTYMWAAINADKTKEQFDSRLKGIGVPNLHLGEIKQTKIVVPPLALQQEFETFVTQVDKPRFAILQQIEKLETLKASLMQEYFG